MTDEPIVLGIETAVAGGSLSLCLGESEAVHWQGLEKALRAEELLIRIEAILKSAGVRKREVNMIAVSAGPGSFTGIRVGIATALGLSRSLAAEFASFSVLEAMASSRRLTGTAAIPMGRGGACAQFFDSGNPVAAAINCAAGDLADIRQGTLVVHPGLAGAIQADDVCVFRSTLANALAQIALQKPGTRTAPIFISRPIDK